jgi:hypothetical protein
MSADNFPPFRDAEEEDALPPHKREGYAERMYEAADARRKARKEEALLAQHEAAIEWAISTGAKP